jgi:hypothetical protein
MELSIREKKTARQETGRGVRCLARMCQLLIRLHANGPDPKDVAGVHDVVVPDAGRTHGRNVIGRRTKRQCAGGMEAATKFHDSTISKTAAICVPGAM